ncbi:MAG: FtsQ-type POTRA domain-containing protein [Gordonia sp. (in: high G+C Gram-positive bacteria)]
MARFVRTGRGLRVVLGVCGVVAVTVGLVLIAYCTPLMSVRSTEVSGSRGLQTAEIVHAAAVPSGTPLLQVNTGSVARRVAAIPAVESARVQREYPSSLRITVVERQPVVRVVDGDTVHILDRNGIGYLRYAAKGLPGEFATLPVFSTPTPGPADPTTLAAIRAVVDLPRTLSARIVKVSASSPVDIEFTLAGNRTVVWGDSSRAAEKARTLRYLLVRDAKEYNVSSPEFPAYR